MIQRRTGVDSTGKSDLMTIEVADIRASRVFADAASTDGPGETHS